MIHDVVKSKYQHQEDPRIDYRRFLCEASIVSWEK
jgi:hypothetical protein